MYEDGDYQDFYYEILGRFPGLDRKFGLQHSDLRDALCVHIDENAGASESDAKEFLEWAKYDNSFVFAHVEQSSFGRTWEFVFTDLGDTERLRSFMTYFLPVGQNMPDEVEDLSKRLFLNGNVSFSSKKTSKSDEVACEVQPETKKFVQNSTMPGIMGC